MAWTTPRTWSIAEKVTKAMMDTHVRDNMNEVWHEVAYAEFTADVSVTTASTEGSPLDVVSSGAVTYAAVPTLIEFFAPGLVVNSAGSGRMGFNLWDATDLGRFVFDLGSTAAGQPLYFARRLTPTAASHTYKIRAWATVNTQVVKAGAGGVATLVPGFIRVLQRGSA